MSLTDDSLSIDKFKSNIKSQLDCLLMFKYTPKTEVLYAGYIKHLRTCFAHKIHMPSDECLMFNAEFYRRTDRIEHRSDLGYSPKLSIAKIYLTTGKVLKQNEYWFRIYVQKELVLNNFIRYYLQQ
eukprot:221980_1